MGKGIFTRISLIDANTSIQILDRLPESAGKAAIQFSLQSGVAQITVHVINQAISADFKGNPFAGGAM